jgi:transcriptional regulator with XRE-family HTH domain
MVVMEHLAKMLEQRRRQLGMSYAVRAKRSGVSMPTVVRLLHGKHYGTSFRSVYAVAQTLGVRFDQAPVDRVDDLLEGQARSKPARLTRILQGTSALEGQGLDQDDLERMRQ